MFQNNLNSRDNIISLDKEKGISNNYDSNTLSLAETSLSMKDSKKLEDIKVSDFQEILKPYSSIPFERYIKNENINYYQLIDHNLNTIKIDSPKKSITLIGKKRHIKNNIEFFMKNNKSEENKTQEIESESSLNKSAFKKIEIEIGKGFQTYNKSAFKTHIIYTKEKSNNKSKKKNQNKIKKIENKIIINEMNNNVKEEKKRNLFKSINYGNDTINDKENNTENKVEKKRRGRKPKSDTKSKKLHEASDYDNILRKIQVHFLTFIISFVNDLLDNLLPNNKDLRFKNLDYNLKKTVNHSYMEGLKNKTIGEILQFEASSKIRKFSNTINKQIYQNVIQLSPFLNNFFNMPYLQLFNNYYLKCNRTFNIGEGIIINISQKTKLFSDLIQKNCDSASKINQIATHNFMEETNDNKQPIFVINKKNI